MNGLLTAGRIIFALAIVFLAWSFISLFVAVAMGGLSFALAGAYGRDLEGRGAFTL